MKKAKIRKFGLKNANLAIHSFILLPRIDSVCKKHPYEDFLHMKISHKDKGNVSFSKCIGTI